MNCEGRGSSGPLESFAAIGDNARNQRFKIGVGHAQMENPALPVAEIVFIRRYRWINELKEFETDAIG